MKPIPLALTAAINSDIIMVVEYNALILYYFLSRLKWHEKSTERDKVIKLTAVTAVGVNYQENVAFQPMWVLLAKFILPRNVIQIYWFELDQDQILNF